MQNFSNSYIKRFNSCKITPSGFTNAAMKHSKNRPFHSFLKPHWLGGKQTFVGRQRFKAIWIIAHKVVVNPFVNYTPHKKKLKIIRCHIQKFCNLTSCVAYPKCKPRNAMAQDINSWICHDEKNGCHMVYYGQRQAPVFRKPSQGNISIHGLDCWYRFCNIKTQESLRITIPKPTTKITRFFTQFKVPTKLNLLSYLEELSK